MCWTIGWLGVREEPSRGARVYAVKREEGTGRPLTGKEKGLVIPLDFYHWLQVASDSRNHLAFLLYLWLVCLHSLSALVFIPP